MALSSSVLSLALLALLVCSAFAAESAKVTVNAEGAAQYALTEAGLINPSAIIKKRGVTKPNPSVNEWTVELLVNSEICTMVIREKDELIGFTIDNSPYIAVNDTTKECVLCCNAKAY